MTMELEEYIKDGFDDSLRDYIQSEKYMSQKQQENDLLVEFQSNLSDDQKQQFILFLNAATTSNGMLISEAYMHGVVEGIALRDKVVKY